MKYSDAERFLLMQRPRGIKLGLGKMLRAMEVLQQPEGTFPSVLVAGSKGKGSVAAFLVSILREAGLPAGLYTSPHLMQMTERIRVDGEAITKRAAAALVASLRPPIEGDGIFLTYFEWLTVMAIVHFSRRRVPLAVFEVGLGGRLDATNILPATLSIITEIEKEHTRFLGTTLAEIAREKSGVIRTGAPLLSGAVSPTAAGEIGRQVRLKGAGLLLLDREARWEVTGHSLKGVDMNLATGGEEYNGLRLGLLGRHQARNAALAVAAAGQLKLQGFSIGKGAVRRGLARARWPARCEYIPGRPAFLIDGAHTPSSAAALAAMVDELFPGRRRVLLFAVLKDKKIERLASILFPRCARVVVLRAPDSRGAEPEDIIRRLGAKERKRCRIAGDTDAALAMGITAAGPDGLVIVAGSFYLAGAVLGLLGSGKGG